MLSFFREKAAVIVWSLIIFFGATMFAGTIFFGGGIGDAGFAEDPKEAHMAVLGDIRVTDRTYRHFLGQSTAGLTEGQRQQLDPTVIELIHLNAFNRALQYSVFLKEAIAMDLDINKKTELEPALDSVYRQVDVKGKRELKAYLKERGYPYREFINSIKKEILVRKYAQQLQADIQVTDNDVDRAFKRVDVAHILISNENRSDEEALRVAMDVEKKIRGGANFGEMAKTFSEDPATSQSGGEMGEIGIFDTVKAFEDIAFNLNKGELSSPVKSFRGYHLIKVNDVKAMEKPTDFDDAQIRKRILEQRQNQALQQAIVDRTSKNTLEIYDPVVRAVHAKMEGKTDDAISAYHKQISIQPSNPLPHYLLGRLYLLDDDIEKAFLEFQKADILTISNPSLDRYYYRMGLGSVYGKKREFRKRDAQYKKAIVLATGNELALRALQKEFRDLNAKKPLIEVNASLAALEREQREAAEAEAKAKADAIKAQTAADIKPTQSVVD